MPCSNFFLDAAVSAALTRGSRDATVFVATCTRRLLVRFPALRLRAVLVGRLCGDFRVEAMTVLDVMAILAFLQETLPTLSRLLWSASKDQELED
jgi:hypothetical protein